jgi:ABC-type branched-subunit amino acid transport system ATPase component
VAMSFGRKIAEGEPREVMASRAVQEVYLGVVPA